MMRDLSCARRSLRAVIALPPAARPLQRLRVLDLSLLAEAEHFRAAAELRAASVRPEGFDLLAIPMNEIPARIAELDPARPLAVLCHHGARSMQVASFLKHHGFEHVANVAGGIDAWSVEVDASVPRY